MADQANRTLRSVAWVRGIVLLLIVAVALFVRTSFVYDQCFPGDYVNFQAADPWYHVRAVEHLIHQFPHRITFDPYALHPKGQYVAVAPLYDLILAAIALVVGLGTPSTELTQTICAWFPSVLGALVTIPVYFLGRIVRNHQAGLAAAALIAVIPGQFLRRTLLGSTDHHVAECMLSVLTMLFLIRAIVSTDDSTAAHRLSCTADKLRPRVLALRALPAGLFLGFYLLTWVGGSLFVLVLFVALVLQVVSAQLRGHNAVRLCLLGAVMFLVALLMVLPFGGVPGFCYHIASLSGAASFLLMSAVLAANLRSRAWPRISFLLSVGTLAIVGAAALRIAAPAIFNNVITEVRRFAEDGAGERVGEASPLLYVDGTFTLIPLWEMFNVSTAVTVVALALFVHAAIRRGSAVATILVVWTILIALAMLYQRRFAYYLALNIAILSGSVWGLALDSVFKWKGTDRSRKALTVRCVGVAAFVAFGLCPNIPQALTVAHEHAGPLPDWHHALSWLQKNSPEPFGDPDAYYARYETPTRDKPYVPPPSAYGVMCWWDQGYWISQIARRVPTANPTQTGAVEAARFLTAQDETAANQIMVQCGAKYVIVEGSLPIWEKTDPRRLIGKFHNIIKWAGQDPSDYFETYYVPNGDGSYKLMTLYYPKYFRSMLTRLYIFAGKEFIPDGMTFGVQFTEMTDSAENPVKRVDRAVRFTDFEAGKQFVAEQPEQNWRIVGNTHALSCVPLEPLRQYRLVYKSPTTVARTPTEEISFVEIFEFLEAPDLSKQPEAHHGP